jgi:hypothetical protein
MTVQSFQQIVKFCSISFVFKKWMNQMSVIDPIDRRYTNWTDYPHSLHHNSVKQFL